MINGGCTILFRVRKILSILLNFFPPLPVSSPVFDILDVWEPWEDDPPRIPFMNYSTEFELQTREFLLFRLISIGKLWYSGIFKDVLIRRLASSWRAIGENDRAEVSWWALPHDVCWNIFINCQIRRMAQGDLSSERDIIV